MEADSASRPDLLPLKEGLEPASQCWVSQLHVTHVVLCQQFSRLTISPEHPLPANPHPYRNTTAPGYTKHDGKDGSSAMLRYRRAQGIHSSLRRNPRGHGPGGGAEQCRYSPPHPLPPPPSVLGAARLFREQSPSPSQTGGPEVEPSPGGTLLPLRPCLQHMPITSAGPLD